MSGSLIHVSRRAMACEFEVRFPAEKRERGTNAALEALDVVETLEGKLSYFRPTSELNRINLRAADEPIEVSEPLFDLLSLAMALYAETAGAYDITAAPLWEVWGFARRAGEVPSEAKLAEARSRVGGHLVELDAARRTVRFHKPGVRINLGSIGKGCALDVCAGRLLASGMTDFLLHAGQSSVLARGSLGGTPRDFSPLRAPTEGWSGEGQGVRAGEDSGFRVQGSDSSADPSSTSPHPSPLPKGEGTDLQTRPLLTPWEIGIRHPHRLNHRLGVVRLLDRALGTSGGQFQSFRHQGRRYGHILDPRTGWPAEGVLSTTVVAPTAARADALSTAFYVMGPERSLEYCGRHPDIGAVVLCTGVQKGSVEIHTAGLGEQQLTLY